MINCDPGLSLGQRSRRVCLSREWNGGAWSQRHGLERSFFRGHTN